MTVKVAAVQCSADFGEVDANRRKLTALVREAAAGGAKIIVLPEAALTGYLSQDLRHNWHLPGRPLEAVYLGRDPLPVAETVPGPATDHFASLARELSVYITITLIEVDRSSRGKEETPRLFNTAVLVSPAGDIAAHYRKLFPWPHPEQSWATPGDRGLQVYDTEYGRVGIAICFDIHTVIESYAEHRLWALLHPIAWADESHPADWFWHELPRRSAPYEHYVIGANWSVDKKQAWYGYGFSSILSPTGAVLATAKSIYGSEIVYATLETAAEQ